MEKGNDTQTPAELNVSELHVSWEQSGPRKQQTPQGNDKFL